MNDDKIAVIGLGYVGLPLAAAFGAKHETIGFDIDSQRIEELRRGVDRTGELDLQGFQAAKKLKFASDLQDIRTCNFYIVCVPTPVDSHNRPDLTPLEKASRTVGQVLSKGDIVVYESTVYPGATEEVCVPILEDVSGLSFNTDFYCGYSPERINPGDKVHTVTKIRKVTSGSTPEAADRIDALYASVIEAGTFKAADIRTAEAAKVIENSQRDINIAFVNELAVIFERLGLDTNAVLEAAGTKWNFLPFKPGLVGGHCIGVDPYYLAYKAEEVGYRPEIILAGRRLNDGMGAHIAGRVVKGLIKSGRRVAESRVLVLGLTFKENCPDIRNTRVVDVVRELEDFRVEVSVFDPLADASEVNEEYGIELHTVLPAQGGWDAVILAVAHDEFIELDVRRLAGNSGVIFDVKGVLPAGVADMRL
jgi:UDP-N-acetyl-D-galactosamine dehydrogenase